MRTVALALTVPLLFWCFVDDAHAFPGDTRTYCAARFQSYSMQAQCVQYEQAARERVARRYHSFQGIDRDIYAVCARQWESWDMLEHCINVAERTGRDGAQVSTCTKTDYASGWVTVCE